MRSRAQWPRTPLLLVVAGIASLFVLAPFARADKPEPLSAQTLKLPSGPSSLKGLGESFSPDAASGTGSFSVPLEVPPGFLSPKLALNYNGGHGKGEVGAGWRMPRFRIYRTTDKGLPKFTDRDRFGVEGPGLNDELVEVDPVNHGYRLKNEGAFALFEWDIAGSRWVIHLKDGSTAHLGESEESRDTNPKGTYRWYIERETDQFGHSIAYTYVHDQRHCYLTAIEYQLHASTAYRNRIAFTYEPRSDVFTDYTYGYADTTSRRLSKIETFHGSRRMRSYSLTYESGLLTSLLQSVEVEGEFGLKMPKLTFGYTPHSNQGQPLVTMDPAPPLEGLLNGSATLEDVNGDALPDILYGALDGWYYYENIDGKHWSEWPIANSPDRTLDESGAMMLDANGDGFRDFLIPFYNSFRYYPGGDIEEGLFHGFGEPIELVPDGEWSFDFSSNLVRVSDLNADGRVDLVYQRPGALSQILNTETNRLEETALPELPLDVDFLDPRVHLVDFNGDGILDFVRKEIDYERAKVSVWFGLGWGKYAPEQEMKAVPKGDGAEFYLQDVNGDGQTDLLWISGSSVTYYLNDGNMRFVGPKGDYRGLPGTYQANKILFGDMNGNGTTDVVWLTTDFEIKYLDLMVEPFFGLLTKIDNGMGQVTTISYRSSTEYLIEAKKAGKRWKTPIVRGQPVISEMRVSDSFDKLGFEQTESRVSYDYRDGYYDGREREFRGFGEVEVTEHGDENHESKVTRTWFSVGRNLETGEDEEILKGKPIRQRITDDKGNLYSTVETEWERKWLCQEALDPNAARKVLPKCSLYSDKEKSKDHLVALGVQVGALSATWERTSTPKYTYSASQTDLWGNEIEKASYGEVHLIGGHRFGDPIQPGQFDYATGEDEVIVETAYINNYTDPSHLLIGLPYESTTKDLKGDPQKLSRTYYDGLDFQGMALGTAEKGKPTREEAWLSENAATWATGRYVFTKRSAYDGHGQLIETRDANNNQRQYEYDLETHSFLTAEKVIVEVGTLTYSAQYDRGLGAITSATDFNGNTSRFEYDGLGRLRKVIDPLGTSEVPLHRYSYEYGTKEHPISTTTVESLIDRAGTGTYNPSQIYSDGLGRKRMTKLRAEAPHGYVASGWQTLSPRGAATHVYRSFASQFLGIERPPTGTPETIDYLDALDRKVKTYPPEVGYGETYTATVYLPFETQVFDERDTYEGTWLYPAVTRVDGQGRVKEIIKHNDGPGGRIQLQWTVSYDTVGNITGIVDPQNHPRSYTYDTLGRRTEIDDPNAGVIENAYDDAGNLIKRTDALGQELVSEYGQANRLHAVHMRQDINGRPNRSTIFHYDTPSIAMPEATNLLGQVSWVEESIGTLQWSYDEQGRAVATVRELWDPKRSSEANQERDTFRVDFQLDPQGKVLSSSLPEGLSLKYSYNPRDLLARIDKQWGSDPATLLTTSQYDPQGKPVRDDYANGLATCNWYDSRDRLAETTTGTLSSSACSSGPDAENGFLHLKYSFTPDGLIKGITDKSLEAPQVPRLTADYTYDRLYQLKTAQTTEGTLQYTYDTIQNLIKQESDSSVPGLPLGDFAYGENGAGPNAITSAGEEHYTYDAAGRLKSYHGFNLVFDVQNRLVEANRGDGTWIRNYYDFAGERSIKVSQRSGEATKVYRYPLEGYQERDRDKTWVVSAGFEKVVEIAETPGLVPTLQVLEQLIAYLQNPATQPRPAPKELLDFDGDGTSFDAEDLARATQRYWNGEVETGAASVKVVRYYHRDHLGAPTHVSDSEGIWSSLGRFYPYGQHRNRLGTQPIYGFAGGETEIEDELGLKRFGARWYAPEVGRWIAPDAFFVEAPNRGILSPLEIGAFSYATNSPNSHLDSEGKWTAEVHETTFNNAFPRLPISAQNQMAAGSKNVDKFWDQFDKGTAPRHSMLEKGMTKQEGEAARAGFMKECADKAKAWFEVAKQAKAAESSSVRVGVVEINGELWLGTPSEIQRDALAQAYYHLGEFFHPIQDSTSRLHVAYGGEWKTWPSEVYRHGGKEEDSLAFYGHGQETIQRMREAKKEYFGDEYKEYFGEN